jgi:hypothetical protein
MRKPCNLKTKGTSLEDHSPGTPKDTSQVAFSYQ